MSSTRRRSVSPSAIREPVDVARQRRELELGGLLDPLVVVTRGEASGRTPDRVDGMDDPACDEERQQADDDEAGDQGEGQRRPQGVDERAMRLELVIAPRRDLRGANAIVELGGGEQRERHRERRDHRDRDDRIGDEQTDIEAAEILHAGVPTNL